MRKPNLRIIGIKETKDLQLERPVNIFKNIIEENFPNLKKVMPMNIQEAYRTPNRLGQNRKFSQHIIINTKCTKQTKNIKSSKGKRASNLQRQTYQNYIRLFPRDHESQKILGRRSLTDPKREHRFPPRLLYPAKLSVFIDGETKIFHKRTKFT